MSTKPRFVYKYRSLDNIDRTIDILENNRLYFPTKDELNDPLEGLAQPIYFTYMGIDAYRSRDLEQPESKQFFNQFRILSLARRWDNMQMWAHYANNYEGICLEYSVNKEFCNIKEVIYSERRFQSMTFEGPELIDRSIEERICNSNFYRKSKNWKYEEEWRIVKKQSDHYFVYNPNCLKSVIFGNLARIDSNKVLEVYQHCKRLDVAVFYVCTQLEHYGLKKLPFNIIDYKRGLYDPRNTEAFNPYTGERIIMHHHDNGIITVQREN